jgi:signal transduction histidine kinase
VEGNSEADPEISIRGKGPGFFLKKKKSDFKQFGLRNIERYRGVIQSENYKTW